MNFNQLNLQNLMALWQAYGAKSSSPTNEVMLYNHTLWPKKSWFTATNGQFINLDELTLAQRQYWLSNVQSNTALPVISALNTQLNTSNSPDNKITDLLGHQWQYKSTQVAMYMHVENAPKQQLVERDELMLTNVTSTADIQAWIDVCYDSFGYRIDAEVVSRLLTNNQVKLVLVLCHDKPCATGLLFKTGATVGVHQVSVSPSFQGQGIAKWLMINLLNQSVDWQAENIVLQASTMGKPLYDKLGFKGQFFINNYQKTT